MPIININSNTICALDILTTGPKAHFNDIINIAIIPMDPDLKIRRDIVPFNLPMQPRRPYNVDITNLPIPREEYAKLLIQAHDPDTVGDLFAEWYKRFKLRENKGIIPLVYDWGAKREFLVDWLGIENYLYHFVDKPRDVLSVVLYENDRSEHNCETIPYPKTNFTYICNTLGVEKSRIKGDVLDNALCIAEAYRRTLKRSIF